MANLKDVAKAAGVSTVTASSVLSGANRVRVSDETAIRIRETARRMNYVPRAAARGLRTGRTHVIGFINSPNTHWHPHWQEVLRGVSDLLWNREERLMLSLPRSEEQELELLRQLAFGHQVDGLVVHDIVRNDPRVRMLDESGVPYVSVGGEQGGGAHAVCFDNARFASLLVTDMLQECGGLVLIASRPRTACDQDLVTGAEAAAREQGALFRCWSGAYLPEASWIADAAQAANGPPLGILLARQLLPELISRLKGAGLSLGDDIRVRYLAGVDEVVLPPPGLTVVPLDHYTLGREATKRLVRLIDRNDDEPPIPPERMLILPGAAQRLADGRSTDA